MSKTALISGDILDYFIPAGATSPFIQIMETCQKREEDRRLPDHPVHDQDVPQKSHHADDGVQSRDGGGDGDPRGAAPRNLLPAGVQQPLRRLFVRECDVEGDDGVKVGQGELRPRRRDRFHDAAARSAEELLRGGSGYEEKSEEEE